MTEPEFTTPPMGHCLSHSRYEAGCDGCRRNHRLVPDRGRPGLGGFTSNAEMCGEAAALLELLDATDRAVRGDEHPERVRRALEDMRTLATLELVAVAPGERMRPTTPLKRVVACAECIYARPAPAETPKPMVGVIGGGWQCRLLPGSQPWMDKDAGCAQGAPSREGGNADNG